MFRISNGFRVIEDAVGFVVVSAAHKVARGAHAVNVEYRARQLAAAELRQRKLDAKFAKLTDEELDDLAAEHAEVLARAAELRRGKR